MPFPGFGYPGPAPDSKDDKKPNSVECPYPIPLFTPPGGAPYGYPVPVPIESPDKKGVQMVYMMPFPYPPPPPPAPKSEK
jgi:hypothetical protein